MKGVTFYLSHDLPQDKRKGNHDGNVVAVFTCNGPHYEQVADGRMVAVYEGLGAVFFHPNSEVAGTSIGANWLRECGKRISEAKARTIHPKMFERLDNAEATHD